MTNPRRAGIWEDPGSLLTSQPRMEVSSRFCKRPRFRRNWRMMKEYRWSWRLTSVCTCTGAWTPSPPHHHHTQWPCWPLSTFPLEPKSSSADSVSELPVLLITPLTRIQWRGLTNTWHYVLSAVLSTYFTDPHRTIEMDIVCICSN